MNILLFSEIKINILTLHNHGHSLISCPLSLLKLLILGIIISIAKVTHFYSQHCHLVIRFNCVQLVIAIFTICPVTRRNERWVKFSCVWDGNEHFLWCSPFYVYYCIPSNPVISSPLGGKIIFFSKIS
jgi:hypothetical protein